MDGVKKVTYMYPYVGTGRASVALRYTPKFDGEQYVEMAVAWCSPKDQFWRKRGRRMVHQLLDKKDPAPFECVEYAIKPGDRIKDRAMDVLEQMIDNRACPAWARKHRKLRDGAKMSLLVF